MAKKVKKAAKRVRKPSKPQVGNIVWIDSDECYGIITDYDEDDDTGASYDSPYKVLRYDDEGDENYTSSLNALDFTVIKGVTKKDLKKVKVSNQFTSLVVKGADHIMVGCNKVMKSDIKKILTALG